MQSEKNTVLLNSEDNVIDELSTYLEVLRSPVRLKIVKILEKKPMDARSVAGEIHTSYENTKKHLDRLLAIGVITKKAGLGRETSKGVHPVWLYEPREDGLTSIARDLLIFSNEGTIEKSSSLDKQISDVQRNVLFLISEGNPLITIIGGPDNGKVFPLIEAETGIGRGEPGFEPESKKSFILSPAYRAVTRIRKPHGLFFKEGDNIFYSDEESTGGSYLNNKRLTPKSRVLLTDSDRLSLGEGTYHAEILFLRHQ